MSASTPASPSNNVMKEKPDTTLAEVVRKLNTEKLIKFLRGEEDLQLDENDFKILPGENHWPRKSFNVME